MYDDNNDSSLFADNVVSVSNFVSEMRDLVHGAWPESIWLSGELSNVKTYGSGHVYLNLKDARAELPCIIFQRDTFSLTAQPEEGMAVNVLGRPTIYPAKGRFQLIITDIRPQGMGSLYEQFLKLKETLSNKGWFDDDHKRVLPFLPKQIAVVVSTSGAAWKDVKKTLSKRFPQAKITAYEAPAQGKDAEIKIAKAINAVSKSNADVAIVCRGGGSFEDLATYNSIEVATAIFECKVPIVTGVGHESDYTIADFVADKRAATPTAAAVAVVPDQNELIRQIDVLAERLDSVTMQFVDGANQDLAEIQDELVSTLEVFCAHQQEVLAAKKSLLLANANTYVQQHKNNFVGIEAKMQSFIHQFAVFKDRLLQLQSRALASVKHLLKQQITRLSANTSQLNVLSPKQTMLRGYTVVLDSNNALVMKSKQLQKGQSAFITFADGTRESIIGEQVPQVNWLDDQEQITNNKEC